MIYPEVKQKSTQPGLWGEVKEL